MGVKPIRDRPGALWDPSQTFSVRVKYSIWGEPCWEVMYRGLPYMCNSLGDLQAAWDIALDDSPINKEEEVGRAD